MVVDNYYRVYPTGNMAILHHPIRISLLDLINKGIETVPDMSAILNIPRSNLYHHLSILEKEGFVDSYFLNDRINFDAFFFDDIEERFDIVFLCNVSMMNLSSATKIRFSKILEARRKRGLLTIIGSQDKYYSALQRY